MKQINIHTSEAQKEILKRAAEKVSLNLSAFIRSTVVKEANKILKEDSA